MAERFDAIVIGVGQAAPALCARLDKEGLKTAVVERKLLGDKTGGGFYKKEKKPGGGEPERLALNWKTLAYAPRSKPKFAALEMAKNIDSLPERLRNLLELPTGASASAAGAQPSGRPKTKEGRFLWSALADVWNYAADRIPEAADRTPEVAVSAARLTALPARATASLVAPYAVLPMELPFPSPLRVM